MTPSATRKADQDTFAGWPADFRRFFTGLARDNTRAYFQSNAEMYQRAVRGPTLALMTSLEPEYGPGRIFRINRDLRFGEDKRPYHTNIAVEFATTGTHYYLSASADELIASVGILRGDRHWISRYRDSVAGPAGRQLAAILTGLDSRGFDIGGPDLVKVPRGYPPEHPSADLLRRRSVTATKRWPTEAWLADPATRDLIADSWHQAEDLAGWLRRHAPTGARHGR